MNTEPKPFASLSSGLLARKGQARPAMRPQGFTGGYASLAGTMDDLGWNDMGQALEPAADVHEALAVDDAVPASMVIPQVLAQRAQLTEEFAAEIAETNVEPEAIIETAPTPVVTLTASRPVSVRTAERIARETRQKKQLGAKAAFTLRLDEDRHLRLRLASALSGRSAQVLVTEALDAFLESLPEVEDLARQVPVRAKG
jgi:hypothetical protein